MSTEDSLSSVIRDLGSRQKRVVEINRYCEGQFQKNRIQGFDKAKGYSSGTYTRLRRRADERRFTHALLFDSRRCLDLSRTEHRESKSDRITENCR